MRGWLRDFASESHSDEKRAATWHWLHVGVYGLLMVLYTGSILWHVAAAQRHREAAEAQAGDHRTIP